MPFFFAGVSSDDIFNDIRRRIRLYRGRKITLADGTPVQQVCVRYRNGGIARAVNPGSENALYQFVAQRYGENWDLYMSI
jgi:hypothetical protein